MTSNIDDRARLFLYADVAGEVFGTEDFCIFLYSLVRMHAPHTIVELGTGLGASSFAMALAAKRNGAGHVWTIDDLELFASYDTLITEVSAHLERVGFARIDASTPNQYFDQVADIFDVRSTISFVKRKIELQDPRHFDDYPFADKPIDILFSDWQHAPADILSLLGHFLPRMSSASSILIDSAPTNWSSYLLLEQLVSQLNCGQVPKALQECCSVDLIPVMRNRRIVLVHITEAKKREQNSAAWLKIEPIDLLPHPRTRMRGFDAQSRTAT